MLFHGIEEEQPRPVTLSKVDWLDKAPLEDTREAAARFAQQRTIRAGIEAWQAITKAESFDGWKAIGKALQVGRDHAMRATGANAPMGRRYSKAFGEWIIDHHFDRMPKSTRSVALELNEHLPAIEAWRAGLTDKQRRRCIHPLSNVRRWRATTAPKAKPDAQEAAAAAWLRFVGCMNSLLPDQAAPLWREAHQRSTVNLHPLQSA